jgi:hypothetical protein
MINGSVAMKVINYGILYAFVLLVEIGYNFDA